MRTRTQVGRARKTRGSQASGFTLIEVMISAGLMALILVSAYLCLNAAVATQRMVEPRVEMVQSARVAMALITADLRVACPLSKEQAFLGMHRMVEQAEADNLDFGTHNYTPKRAGEGDFCQTSYYLDKDTASGQFGLWRRRNPRIALNALTGGSREEIARGVAGLRFEYYDGFDWYDTWGDVEGRGKAESSLRSRANLAGMPEAVRITLWLNPKPEAKRTQEEREKAEPPLAFQTVARLNLAATATATTSADSTPANATPTSPTGPNEGGRP